MTLHHVQADPIINTELDVLLDRLGREHYLFEVFQTDRNEPEVLAAVRIWGDYADVLVIFGEDHAAGYRMPLGPGVDVYAPRRVLWWYRHTTVWTLRALLTLSPPGHPGAPEMLTDAPAGLGIPAESRTPVRVTPINH